MTPFKPWGAAPTVFPAACILPFEPNWSSPVQETLAWRMAPTLTQSGAEQRRSLRREPRQSIEFTSAILPGELPLLQSILWGWANSTFAVPLWYGKTRLTNTGTAGASTLLLDDSPETLFQVGGWALIWASTRSLEAVKIASITGNVLGLDATLAATWPAGTAIAPLQFMQLQDSMEHTPLTSTVTQVSWIFSQEPGHAPSLEQWAASTWSEVFPTGADAAEPRNHFFSFPHNWAGSPSTGISTKVSVFDPGLSVLSRRAAVDRPTPHWAIDTLLDGRAATAQLRKFLSAHAGATVGFWAASPVADIALTADVTGTTLSVVDNGQLAVPSPLRTGVEVVAEGPLSEVPLVRHSLNTQVSLSGKHYLRNQTFGSNFQSAWAILPPQTGRRYFEVRVGASSPDNWYFGFVSRAVAFDFFGEMKYPDNPTGTSGIWVLSSGTVGGAVTGFYINGSIVGNSACVVGVGSTVGFSVDWGSREVWAYVGGIPTNSGAPAFTLPAGEFDFYVSTYGIGSKFWSAALETSAQYFGESAPAGFDTYPTGGRNNIRELVSSIGATSITLAADPLNADLGDVVRASWVARARLAVDAITISHLTDRVATCRLPVVAVDTLAP